MTDTVKAWIQERRSIHADGTDVLLRSSYELERESGIEEGTDIDAIVDAHNEFPKALTALSKVLGLHVCLRNSASALYPTPLCTCGQNYPCLTVQAIERAIKDG